MPLQLKTWPLSQLPGLSVEHQAQLQAVGLMTTTELLKKTPSAVAIQALATRLGIPNRYPRKWHALANLSRLPSVGCQHCGLLLHVGVQSAQQLSVMPPGRLHAQIKRLHTASMRRADLCPTPDQVVMWIQEAQQLVKR